MITTRTTPVSIAILICIAIGMGGCGDNLSRSEAKEQLQECLDGNCNKVPFQDTCTWHIRKSFVSDYGSTSYFCPVILDTKLSEEERNFLNFSVDKGLVKIDKEQVTQGCSYWTVNHIIITEEGSKYLIAGNGQRNIWTATFSIGEVTGIMVDKDKTTSTVEYKIERLKQSPFGEFWPINCNDTGRVFKTTFTKYDDGWRL